MTDSIQVISWNILNPDLDFVKMSLRPVVNQSQGKRNFSSAVYEKSRKLAVINEKRYQSQRKPDILGIIAKWFSDNPTRFVLCLQEVCPDMFEALLAIYGENRIRITSEHDINPKINREIYDHRCTIISEDLVFIEFHDIVLQTRNIIDSKEVIVKKNALYCKIGIRETGVEFDCVNLHFFYTWSDQNLSQVFQTIFGFLSQSQRFFICGDFNKPYKKIYEIMEEISVNNKDKRLYMPAPPMPAISNNPQNSFTSFNTRDKNKRFDPEPVIKGFLSLQVIDHIIVGNLLTMRENPRIISKVNNSEIFYNLSGIEAMLQEDNLLALLNKNSLNENSNKILKKWQSSNHKNISDHNPIIARIEIVPKP
jgi:endonuclease/exonuclease/phosphatase family metal-dependent hydrolase